MAMRTSQAANPQTTTKDAKSTKEPENKSLIAIFPPGVVKVDMSVECNPVAIQLLCQTLLVRGLQQPRAEKSVNLNDAAAHAIGKFVEFHLRALRVLRGDALPFSTAERYGT